MKKYRSKEGYLYFKLEIKTDADRVFIYTQEGTTIDHMMRGATVWTPMVYASPRKRGVTKESGVIRVETKTETVHLMA